MDVLLKIFSGFPIALITSWLTVFFSLQRFRKEKWWEKKTEAYTSLLIALHNSKSFAESNLSAEKYGKELTDKEDLKLREKSRETDAKIYREMDIGGFYLSDKAMSCLNRYKKEVTEANKESSWVEYLMSDLKATNCCIKNLIIIARDDLNVKNI